MGRKNKAAGTGIVINDGTFSGNAFAAGPRAEASVTNRDAQLERARAAVVDLGRELDQLRDGIPPEDAEAAAADVGQVEQALADPPDGNSALSAMARLTATLGGVSGLATALAALRDALVRLF
jgi:hypothetical protein